MKSPLETISDLEITIRDFHKIESRLLSGEIVYAYRDVCRLRADFEKRKAAIIEEAKQNEKQP
jgi:hypothetical protein